MAIFTHFDQGLQRQSMAYSNDRGRNWMKYQGNPIIPNPGLNDFRDPKVCWHPTTKRWVLVLAAGDRVKFYTSENLIEWQFSSDFGELEGAHSGVWECPDLFPLRIEGNAGQEKWVLLVSVGSGAPSGGSGTQYFIGDFDGKRFTNQDPAGEARWIDFGRDNYAGVTFSDIPADHHRRILMGWMSNWSYAHKIPTLPWRGAMTLPREFRLVSDLDENPRLTSRPVSELSKLRHHHTRISRVPISTSAPLTLEPGVAGNSLEIQAQIGLLSASRFGVQIKGGGEVWLTVGYNSCTGKLYLDRRTSGLVAFDNSFGQHIHSTPLPLESGKLQLQIFIDTSSIEVFGNHGRAVLTDLIFPLKEIEEIQCYVLDGHADLIYLDTWALRSIWQE